MLIEIFTSDTISASAVSMSFGDLSDAITASSPQKPWLEEMVPTLVLPLLSDIGAADFTFTMPELGNGLTITRLNFSASEQWWNTQRRCG